MVAKKLLERGYMTDLKSLHEMISFTHTHARLQLTDTHQLRLLSM